MSDGVDSPKPVLVGTDLSAPAAEALQAGALWAWRTKGRLAVCMSIADVVEEALLQRAAVDFITDWVESNTDLKKGAFDVRLTTGSGHAGLIRAAEEIGPEVVVIGPRGAGGSEPGVLGGTAKVVVRHAPCPVLVVHRSPQPGCVVVGTDLSDRATSAVRMAVLESRRRKVDLVVLHALHVPALAFAAFGAAGFRSSLNDIRSVQSEGRSDLRHDVERSLKSVGGEGECIVREGRPSTQLLKLADERKAALVVVGATGRTGLARLALGSEADEVVRHAKCSVLVVRG